MSFFEARVKYLAKRVHDLNGQIFFFVNKGVFMSNMVLVSVFDHAVGEYAPCMCVNSEACPSHYFCINDLFMAELIAFFSFLLLNPY